MTRTTLHIKHKNLPVTSPNQEQMSSDEIIGAVASFEHVLPMLVGDDTLTIAKSSTVADRDETIYIISSSLEKVPLISEIERTLSGLKLGGHIEKTDWQLA